MAAPTDTPTPTPCWSALLKQHHPPPNQTIHDHQSDVSAAGTAADRIFVGSCKSTLGIGVAVVDANAIIQGGERLHNCADKFVSVSEVIHEVRDPKSRHSLDFLPFSIDIMDPTSEALKKVISFAKATGDLQTLSDVDLKLIALTYTLEVQIHGTNHLRDSPPPIHTVNVKRLPEKDLPGWGSNVPNLEEWEALEQAVGDGSNTESRILPLKDLNLNIIPADKDQVIEDGSSANGSEPQYENQDGGDCSITNRRKIFPKKREVNIEGKKMVSDGIDASQGQADDSAGDWLPAVSRSTHRRFLRRKARREMNEASIEKDRQPDENMGDEDHEVAKCPDLVMDENSGESHVMEGKNNDEDLSIILKEMRLEEDDEVLNSTPEGLDSNNLQEVDVTYNDNDDKSDEVDEIKVVNQAIDHLETTSQTCESVDASYNDGSGEQSWMLRSLSESSVACITSDFAMQNVLLQMGLRLLAPGGMQIRELHRWILKCHACYKVTTEIGRIFCPNCGNGGTLRKVAVTVGENGIVLKARRPRVSVRGTKFSLPLPKGGRDAITKNPILREDQLPQKFLHPKTKKKNKQGDDDIFASTDMFLHHTDKRAPLQPPVRKALAVFSGKRNPNDNYYSRARH